MIGEKYLVVIVLPEERSILWQRQESKNLFYRTFSFWHFRLYSSGHVWSLLLLYPTHGEAACVHTSCFPRKTGIIGHCYHSLAYRWKSKKGCQVLLLLWSSTLRRNVHTPNHMNYCMSCLAILFTPLSLLLDQGKIGTFGSNKSSLRWTTSFKPTSSNKY